MNYRTVCFLLCMVPALLAGISGNPWVVAAALLWPCFLIGTVAVAFAARAFLDALR